MKYEISINILDNDYIDSLIVALVRQGYDVYYNAEENVVCYVTYDEEVQEVN